jgi:hypothetical protein
MREAKSQLQRIRDFYESAIPKELDKGNPNLEDDSLPTWWLIDNNHKVAATLRLELDVLSLESCDAHIGGFAFTLDEFERGLLLQTRYSLQNFETAWNRLQCSTVEEFLIADPAGNVPINPRGAMTWSMIPNFSNKRLAIRRASRKEVLREHFKVVPLTPSTPRYPKLWAEEAHLSVPPRFGTALKLANGLAPLWLAVSDKNDEIAIDILDGHYVRHVKRGATHEASPGETQVKKL